MSSPPPNQTPDPSDNNQETVTIVVAVAAGILVVIVLLLCLVVFYLYSRKDKIAEEKTIELDNRHRLFREPANISSRFDDIVDLEGVEQASFFKAEDGAKPATKKKSRSTKESIEAEKEATRSNPTFGKDDIYGDALELNARSRKPREVNDVEGQNGITNLAVDISDEQDPAPQGDDEETTPQESSQHSESGPNSPTSPKLNILNPETWSKVEGENATETQGNVDEGGYEVPASVLGPPTSDGGVSSGNEDAPIETGEPAQVEPHDGGVSTISRRDHGSREDEIDPGDDGGEEEEANDGEDDTYYMYSPFQRSSSQRERSFLTRNSAIIDFYEGASSWGRSRPRDTPAETGGVDLDAFWDGFKGPVTADDGKAQGLLWQNKRIF